MLVHCCHLLMFFWEQRAATRSEPKGNFSSNKIFDACHWHDAWEIWTIALVRLWLDNACAYALHHLQSVWRQNKNIKEAIFCDTLFRYRFIVNYRGTYFARWDDAVLQLAKLHLTVLTVVKKTNGVSLDSISLSCSTHWLAKCTANHARFCVPC